jgi:hypothetical protein
MAEGAIRAQIMRPTSCYNGPVNMAREKRPPQGGSRTSDVHDEVHVGRRPAGMESLSD